MTSLHGTIDGLPAHWNGLRERIYALFTHQAAFTNTTGPSFCGAAGVSLRRWPSLPADADRGRDRGRDHEPNHVERRRGDEGALPPGAEHEVRRKFRGQLATAGSRPRRLFERGDGKHGR